jgi:D-sedoheptulose 7-phosphate isomerase
MTDVTFQDRKLGEAESRVVGIDSLQSYFLHLWNILCRVETTDGAGKRVKHHDAVCSVLADAVDAHNAGGKIIFIGNGGSAAIASHMAADFCKNGGVRTLALNDPAMLTCLSNDIGYEHVFSKQIEMHARSGDVLVAISSSGRSPNILSAVQAAKASKCSVVTMSGFDEDNLLRRAGTWNFYVHADQYGPVEIAHLTLCHAMLDLLCSSKEKAVS